MKWLILITLFFTGSTVLADINCNRHKIYCKIVEVNPEIDKSFAMKLSNLLFKYSRKYNTDPFVSVAIGAQETGLRNINRTERALIKTDTGYHFIDVITDVGLFQFHVNTIEYYEMDIDRLKNDLEYAVENHVKLLRQKIDMCIRRGIPASGAWACYHSYSDGHRQKYRRMVERFL